MIGTTFIDLTLFLYFPEVRVVGLSSFRNLWRKLLPHISSTKPRTDLCWQCQRNNYQVFRSANLPEAVKSAKLKKQEQHLLLVQSERSVYQKMVADCKTTCQDLQLSLGGPTEPASKDIRMHYSFDFAQQVSNISSFILIKDIDG